MGLDGVRTTDPRRGASPGVFLAVLALTGVVQAATLRVPSDFASIRGAIAAAKDGDTVLVAPGTYRASNMRLYGKAITLRSQRGPSVTIIEGDGTPRPIFWIEDHEGPNTVIEGFTLRGGEAQYGGAISIYISSPTISGNVFDSNVQDAGGFGAAISCEGNVGGKVSAPLIVGNVFRNNSCDSQWNAGVVACVNYSSPRIIGNLFEVNPCAAVNVSVIEGSRPEISNNTIVGNFRGVRLNAIVPTRLNIYRNNIIAGNTIGLLLDFSNGYNDPTWSNNLVYGNATDYDGIADQAGVNGNLGLPAMFVDVANGDYRLSPSSPAVDAGLGTSPPLPATDLVGRRRIVDGNGDGVAIVDIGAYEFRTPVGGAVTGVGSIHVICKNARKDQNVKFDVTGSIPWDCEAAGLDVRAGDKITTWATAEVDDDSDDLRGEALGIETSRSECVNLETGDSVRISLQGEVRWNCRDMGLTFGTGDRVRIRVRGSAN